MLHGRWSLVDILLDLLLHLLLEFLAHAFTVLHAHLNDLKCVPDQPPLDSLIHGCICSKRWCVVNLEHPGFQLLIEHDVKAKQLKATVRLLRLATPVDMLQLWLNRHDCFYDNSLDFIPDLSS